MDVKKNGNSGAVTKDDLFETLTQFYAGVVKPDIDSLREETRRGFSEVKQRLDSLEQNAPSRVEFQNLKNRVDKIETVVHIDQN